MKDLRDAQWRSLAKERNAKDKCLRVNRVRYYTFAELKEGLLATLTDEPKKKAVRESLP